ncbi:DUF2939 domain-containing protein [Novosphingobium sp. P6W]|nr:DUF2939 domain-containing protein [Novosphingobium sp. P6W]
MKGLKDAALAGDREELKDRVDFPAIRESLKSQMRAMMVAEMAKEKNNPFGALGMAFAGAIIDPMIDGIVSPEGIKVMVESGKMKDPEKPAAVQTEGREAEWEIERRGLDRFIARPKLKPGDKAPSLIFKRDGLGWDLVDVEAPADPTLSSAAS